MTSRTLKGKLRAAGVDSRLARHALDYDYLFDGDVPSFVQKVKEKLAEDSELELQPESNMPLGAGDLDSGNKTVEGQYTGDVLSHWGYDYENENKRW